MKKLTTSKKNMTILSIITVLFAVLLLTGCQNVRSHDLTLHHDDGSVYDVMKDNDHGNPVGLPVLEEEGKIFLGWTDGETIYYDAVVMTGDLTLTAAFEAIDDVFEFNVSEEAGRASLMAYTGSATHLRIPNEYDGYPVGSIAKHAFYQSTVTEVEIPMSVIHVYGMAFEEATRLERVSYYGTIEGTMTTAMSDKDLEDVVSQHADACAIASTSDDGSVIEYADGCPVIRAEEESRLVIDGDEFIVYEVVVSLALMPKYYTQQISRQAFLNATSLTSIHLPAGAFLISGDVFMGATNLKTITVDENNPHYTVKDNVLLSKDETTLHVYPQGLETGDYAIPGYITTIRSHAFFGNAHLKTIRIHADVDTIVPGSFLDLSNLEAFVVDPANPSFYSEDGVLFYDKPPVSLAAYPEGKAGTSYQLPERVYQIAPYAFAYNDKLTEITFGSGLEVVADAAFLQTTSLSVLDFPNNVRMIGYYIAMDSNVETVIVRRIPTDGGITRFLSMFKRESDDHPILYVPDGTYDAYVDELQDHPLVPFIRPLSEYDDE